MRLIALLTIVFAACAGVAATDPDPGVDNNLFAPADSARASADAASASALAPTLYAEARKKYDDAVKRFQGGGKLDRVAREVAEAAQQFDAAARVAPVTERILSRAWIARSDAVTANAAALAPDLWEEAEEVFNRSARDVERGKHEAAAERSADAEKRFRDAELVAIKARFAGDARRLIAAAEEADAERYAPETFAHANALLAEAEKQLDADRYDTDTARHTAERAEHEARYATYITGEGKRTGNRDIESVILSWEAPLSEIAEVLDVPVNFDDGPENARVVLLTQIQMLVDERTRMQADYDARSDEMSALEAEVARLTNEVGGELAASNRELERQQRNRERIAEVDNTFSRDEAEVVRRGDQLILRIVGLSFDPGSATLRPDHDPLLRKMQQALSLFPLARIVVEGHTDSVGSDALNVDLSERRARAVMGYVLANMPVSPAKITAIGYGEARPVASNETQEGRAKNRRIDIVIED